jgi:hypothetical protein
MQKLNNKVFQSKSSTFTKIALLIGFQTSLFLQKSYGSTSLIASGHAAIVGQASFKNPQNSPNYSALRVPISLLIEARPTDAFSLHLQIDYAYNNFPGPSVYLGQTSDRSTENANGRKSLLPFANSINDSQPYSQNIDNIFITQAYISYQTAIGLFRAGRLPRDWALGVWQNAQWTPYGTLPSTTDSLVLTSDFNTFDISLYYDKYGEGVGGLSADNGGNAFVVEARLKSDLVDFPSSGVHQEIGVQYTKFNHHVSNTNLNILDVYGKFYLSRLFLGGELLYPSGNTQSPNYQFLGGLPACQAGTSNDAQTCLNQKVSALAALMKMKLQLNQKEFVSLAATEKSQTLLGTAERLPSHLAGIWIGYTSGGGNQFASPGVLQQDNNISAISMNPNIQPSFLMFNNTLPAIRGMPGGSMTNSSFIRLDYSFEHPSFGSIAFILAWATLNNINPYFSDQYDPCKTQTTPDPNNSQNLLCVGGSRNLGAEANISYRYTTLDRASFGLDTGYWFVGKAWQSFNQSKPENNYGVRAFAAMDF